MVREPAVWVLCGFDGARRFAAVSIGHGCDGFRARSSTVADTRDATITHGIQEVEGSTPFGSTFRPHTAFQENGSRLFKRLQPLSQASWGALPGVALVAVAVAVEGSILAVSMETH